MTVYVDEMQPLPRQPHPRWRFVTHCHLMADSDAELEAMAKQLRLLARWRHGDHYDLTSERRRLAIKHGAVAISMREMVCVRKKRRSR